jgi:hypothetical protein
MLGKIIALLVVFVIFYVALREYRRCQKGGGGLLNELCHLVT